ncbi:hypothetical protein RSOLAG1IB_06427 [Rhizoctonia solani AG-1 IB]|uniref:Uncharacterized protein n=1 Tax=Thanatephorus cucumeris (strain AG1-IB / isolate 7/3/14) TaxID=1108050 RepID=A0A0B7FBK9_THACB|nr:hypothetical protein RSOLAG1IB_06427 [Rhizoctonia solani AG-1 IB]
MIDKLSAASNRLRDAIDYYLDVCLEIERALEENCHTTLADSIDRMSRELDVLNSHVETIGKAKTTISRARNWSSALPINRLPVELLAQIFQWAVDSERFCANPSSISPTMLPPKYPELLTHVCSRWRKILISSPQFWTHIDFNFWAPDYQSFLDRAERHLARVGERPIHVHHLFSMNRGIDVVARPVSSFAAAGSRASVIEASILVRLESVPAQLYDSLLHLCFHNCVAGKLKRIILSLRQTFLSGLAGAEHIMNPTSNEENIFSSVTSLRLNGLYLPWTSSVYRGLVELHVMPTGSISISESQLITILAASPGLQILDIDIPITQPETLTDLHTSIPIRLNDLTTLRSGSPVLLRLLAPGTKELSVTILRSSVFPFKSNQIREFFTRSNVLCIGISQWESYTQLFDVLELVPRARIAVMSACRHNTELEEIPPLITSLHSLLMIDNQDIRLEDLQKLSEKLKLLQMRLIMNMISYNNKPAYNGLNNVVHNEEAFKQLQNICPYVEISLPI